MAHLATYVGCIWTAPVADDGTITGPWLELGEAHPLSIQLQDEDPTTIKGRTCKTRGLVIGSKPNPGSATGSLTLHEYTTANVAKALKGLVSVNAGAGSALTNQEVHLKGLGEYVEVGSELLSGVTVTDAGGTELHEGVDYSINLTLGMIAAHADAVANTTVKISATVAEDKAGRVTIGAGQSMRVAIKGDLINEYSDEHVRVFLRKCLISSNAEINFVSNEDTDHETIELKLTPEIPTGQSDCGHIDGLPLR